MNIYNAHDITLIIAAAVCGMGLGLILFYLISFPDYQRLTSAVKCLKDQLLAAHKRISDYEDEMGVLRVRVWQQQAACYHSEETEDGGGK